jgi:hypothetical protein
MYIEQTECFDTHKEAWYFMKYCRLRWWPCGYPSERFIDTEGQPFYTICFDGPLEGLEQWQRLQSEGDCPHNTYTWQQVSK